MKALLFAMTALLVTAQVHARSLKMTATAEIQTFNFEAGSDLAKQNITYGTVILDKSTKTITLQLQPKPTCPPGRFCMAMMPAPIMISLPLQEQHTGGCGEVIFTALLDQRPVDGVLQKITLVSNATNICETMVALPAVSITLEYQGGRSNFQERHYMTAGPLL